MAEKLSAKSAWKLNNALKKSAATKPTKVGTARVTRRDSDGSVWVRLPGSNVDTPVNGQILSDAQVGDTVSVRIENGRLSLMGNASTPSVGQQQVNTTVQPVQQTADNALETASTAQTAAELATSYAAAAQVDAKRAKDAADLADGKAQAASASAATAASAAQSALLGLSTVQDVVDVMAWLSAHSVATQDTSVIADKDYYLRDATTGTMTRVEEGVNPTTMGWSEATPSADTEAVEGKVYHELDSTTGVLTPVETIPAGADPSALGWYEVSESTDTRMTDGKSYYTVTVATGVATPISPSSLGWWEMDDAVTQYLAAHLAMTDYGLNLKVDSESGYIHIGTLSNGGEYGTYILDTNVLAKFAAAGMSIYDGEGNSNSNIIAHFTSDGVRVGYDPEDETDVASYFDKDGLRIKTRMDVSPFFLDDIAGLVSAGGQVSEQPYSISSGRSWTYSIENVPLGGFEIKVRTQFVIFGKFVAGTASTYVDDDYGTTEYDGDVTFTHTPNIGSPDTEVYFVYNSIYTGQPTLFVGSIDDTKVRGGNTATIGAGLLAGFESQLVCGEFNDNSQDHAFEIGNGDGSGSKHRSNALAVGWDGSVEAAGAFQSVDPRFDAETPSLAETIYSTWGVRDADGRHVMYLETYETPAGLVATHLGARRVVSGANVDNQINLRVAADGTRSVGLSDRAAWQAALGHTAPTAIPLNSAAVAYSSGQTPKYSKQGYMVNVCGAIKPKNEVAAGGSLAIGTLPTGYRPPQDVNVLCQGSGQAVWLLTISASGAMTASRYRTGNTNQAMTTGVWLVFNATFITTTI